MKRNRVLVTGGGGFIGSHLVDRLLKDGNYVAVIDDLSSGKKEYLNPEATFWNVDISDWSKLAQVFKKEKPEYVFHLAAIPRVPASIEDPVHTSKINILGTINVFKISVDTKIKRVVFASSSSVYGNQKTLPLKETMHPEPVSPYGLQKLAGEQFAKLFSKLYSLPIVCLRYFNVYGPRLDFNSDYSLVIGKFLRQKNQEEPLTIFGDGNQTRAFCYVDDVVNANLKAMQSKKLKGGEIINIAGTMHSINALARMIGGQVEYLPLRVGDVLHTKADISLARRFLGWTPRINLEKGIKKTEQWFKYCMSNKKNVF